VYALPGDGSLIMQPGGVDQFVATRRASRASAAGLPSGSTDGSGAGEAERRQARKDIARVERRIAKLTEREQQLHADMAADAGDYTRLAELQAELSEVTAEKHRLEDEWLEAAEWLTDAG
jgi:ATP-binding cassette subfamily F protein uup